LVASRTFRRKADAELWTREQYRALAFGEFIPPARSAIPFAEVVARFMESRRGQVRPHSWRTDFDNLSGTVAVWGNLPLSSIGGSEVLSYLSEQLAIKAHSTVQRSRTSISALFTYAVREKLLTRNPVREIRMPPGRTQASGGRETFTRTELADTLLRQQAINPWLAEVTEFLSLTGLRWSELRALRVGEVRNSSFPIIRVVRAQSDDYAEKGTKSQRIRIVPLTDRAWDIAEARLDGRDRDDYLFTGTSGVQLRGTVFRRFWKDAGPETGRTIHDLRHYAASDWLRSGIPVHQVAKWLGHANANTTLKVYAHVLGEEQDMAAMAHLNALTKDPRPGRPTGAIAHLPASP
jgi:integrase